MTELPVPNLKNVCNEYRVAFTCCLCCGLCASNMSELFWVLGLPQVKCQGGSAGVRVACRLPWCVGRGWGT